MKKVLLALAGAALLAWAGLAVADYNVVDQGTYYKNAQSGAKTDANGNAYTNDASRDRDRIVKYDAILSDTIAVGMADSTQTTFDTHDVARGYLLIQAVVPKGTAVPFVRLAIRVLGHTASTPDSANTFNWDPCVTTSLIPDSLAYGSAVTPTPVANATTEIVATIAADEGVATGTAMKYPRRNTIIVPLRDNSGAWFWSEYTSVMVRVLSASANSPTITVSYRGVCR